jgi:hypothetical protein
MMLVVVGLNLVLMLMHIWCRIDHLCGARLAVHMPKSDLFKRRVHCIIRSVYVAGVSRPI